MVSEATGGSYHPAGDADTLAESTKSIDLRLTTKKEPVELTARVRRRRACCCWRSARCSCTRWHGRIV